MSMRKIKLDHHFLITAVTKKLFAEFYLNLYPIFFMKFFISHNYLLIFSSSSPSVIELLLVQETFFFDDRSSGFICWVQLSRYEALFLRLGQHLDFSHTIGYVNLVIRTCGPNPVPGGAAVGPEKSIIDLLANGAAGESSQSGTQEGHI